MAGSRAGPGYVGVAEEEKEEDIASPEAVGAVKFAAGGYNQTPNLAWSWELNCPLIVHSSLCWGFI